MCPTQPTPDPKLQVSGHVQDLETKLIEKCGNFEKNTRPKDNEVFSIKLFRPVYATHVVVVTKGSKFIGKIVLDSSGQDVGTYQFTSGKSVIPLGPPTLVREISLVHTAEQRPGGFRVLSLSVLVPREPRRTRRLPERTFVTITTRIDTAAATRDRKDVTLGDEVLSERAELQDGFEFLGFRAHFFRRNMYALFARLFGAAPAATQAAPGVKDVYALARRTLETLPGLAAHAFPEVAPDTSVRFTDGAFPVHSFVMRARCGFFAPEMALPLTLARGLPSLLYIYTGDPRTVINLARRTDAAVAADLAGDAAQSVSRTVAAVCAEMPQFVFPAYPYAAAALLGCSSLMALVEEIAQFNSDILLSEQFLSTVESPFMASLVARKLYFSVEEFVAAGRHRLMTRALLQRVISLKQLGEAALAEPRELPEPYVCGACDDLLARISQPHEGARFVVMRRELGTPDAEGLIGELLEVQAAEKQVRVRFASKEVRAPLAAFLFFATKKEAAVFLK